MLEATWPPAERRAAAGWVLRFDVADAGSRVRSARWADLAHPADADAAVSEATRYYQSRGAPAMLQLGEAPVEQALRHACERAGFRRFDPCALMSAELSVSGPQVGLEAALPIMVIAPAGPLEALHAFWDAHDVGPARRGVMARARGEALAARWRDRIQGGVFLGVSGRHAFLHALAVAADARGHGVGRALVARAAERAVCYGASLLHVSVRTSNAPAQALFKASGFYTTGAYAYWRSSA